VLLDIERIAPCMPGASIASVDGDDFTGSVKVRLGPIGLTYKGKASFTEKDETAHRAVIDAQGKDARGNGTAAAKITATLSESGSETEVAVVTDLNITGKPAQFGRGVMVDVGNKLIGQFADCLAGKLSAGDAADDQPAAETADTTNPAVPAQSAAAETGTPPTAAQTRIAAVPDRNDAIDLLGSAGPAVAKRLAPVAAIAAIVLFFLLRRRRG